MSKVTDAPTGAAKYRKPRPIYVVYEGDGATAGDEIKMSTRSAVKVANFMAENPDCSVKKLELS